MNIFKFPLCIILFTCLAFRPSWAAVNKSPITAILGAFEEEVEIIESEIEDKQFHKLLGLKFITGKLRDRRVVLAQTGIGKVNAAMTASLLVYRFHPQEVIFTGIAGAVDPNLFPGDIIIGAKTAQHDIVIYENDALKTYQVRNPLTGGHNPVFFPANKRLLNLADKAKNNIKLEKIVTRRGGKVPRIMNGTIVTGDAFIASAVKKTELRRRLQADAVEMEGAAVAQICYQQNLPCMVIRSISNSADADVDMDSVSFYQIAAHNSARLVLEIIALLSKEQTVNPGI